MPKNERWIKQWQIGRIMPCTPPVRFGILSSGEFLEKFTEVSADGV
jgi:hypothetical protein